MTARVVRRSRRSTGFRPDVEGLRAVAILAVVLYHAGAVGGGYVGVDVFFVISGFLITGLLQRELRRDGHINFREFYARRVRRLLPLSALVLVATLCVSAAALSPLRLIDVTKDARAAALYVANYRFAAQQMNYLAASKPASPFQHFWSLGVEEQFYAVWPLLMLGVWMLARRVHPRRRDTAMTAAVAALAVASFMLSLAWTHSRQPWAFFSLPTRAWELALGGLVALAARHLGRLSRRAGVMLGWFGIAAVIWSVLAFRSTTTFPGTAALVPTLGTAAVIVAGLRGERTGPAALLGTRPLRFFGAVSYGWYLWHWPVLSLAAARLGHPLAVWQGLALSLLSLLLATATFLAVEYPLRFSTLLASRSRTTLAMGGALTVASLVVTVSLASSIPALHGRGPAQVAAPPLARSPAGRRAPNSWTARLAAIEQPLDSVIARATGIRSVPVNLDPGLLHAADDKADVFVDGCDDTYTDITVRECAFGDTASKRTVVLYGDSHAAQWFPALETIATQRHWRLVALSKATCPAVEISIYSPILGRAFTECDQWRSAVVERIRREHPFLVIAGAARHYGPEYHFTVYGERWQAGITKMIARLRGVARHVVFLGPTPKPNQDIPGCLSEHLDDVEACAQPRSSAVDRDGSIAERNAVRRARGTYVPVAPWLCTPSVCPPIVDNLLVYRDDNHLTTTVTTWLAPVVAAALDAALHRAPLTQA